MSGIAFDEWGAINQHVARGMARDPEIAPMRFRIMFAAMGWANLIGHAEFDPAGLCHVLMKQNPKTGELSIPGSNQVINAIKEARDMGLIGEGSGIRCLVTPDWWQKSGGRGGKTCGHHRIGQAAHRRGVRESGKAHLSGVPDTPQGCADNPLSRANVHALYDSDLTTCTTTDGEAS